MANSDLKYENTRYGGQETDIPRGEVCLQAMLQDEEMPVARLARTQTVRSAQTTHAGAKREVICGIEACGAVVVVETKPDAAGEEVIVSYGNPRVSQLFEACTQEDFPMRVITRSPSEV